jgi:hypothetical protein
MRAVIWFKIDTVKIFACKIGFLNQTTQEEGNYW